MPSDPLAAMIDAARKHVITPEEHTAQVRSFAYGNLNLHDPSITIEDVDQAIKELNHAK